MSDNVMDKLAEYWEREYPMNTIADATPRKNNAAPTPPTLGAYLAGFEDGSRDYAVRLRSVLPALAHLIPVTMQPEEKDAGWAERNRQIAIAIDESEGWKDE